MRGCVQVGPFRIENKHSKSALQKSVIGQRTEMLTAKITLQPLTSQSGLIDINLNVERTPISSTIVLCACFCVFSFYCCPCPCCAFASSFSPWTLWNP
jgi:hypothetical protein